MMTFLNIAFWIALAFDLGVIGLVFVLGLAAAKPSHTNPLSVTFLLLMVPAAILIGLAVLFLRVHSTAAKIGIFIITASPFLVILAGIGVTGVAKLMFPEEANRPMSSRPVPLTELNNAVLDKDAAAVAAPAAAAGLRTRQDFGGIYEFALHRIEKDPARIDILKALIAAGGDPNSIYGNHPLEAAIRLSPKIGPEPVKLLLEAGAKPNANNSTGEPAFFAATAKGIDVEVLKLLLAHGANPKTTSVRGATALQKAEESGNTKAAELLR